MKQTPTYNLCRFCLENVHDFSFVLFLQFFEWLDPEKLIAMRKTVERIQNNCKKNCRKKHAL